jgi:hypothetical protein
MSYIYQPNYQDPNYEESSTFTYPVKGNILQLLYATDPDPRLIYIDEVISTGVRGRWFLQSEGAPTSNSIPVFVSFYDFQKLYQVVS